MQNEKHLDALITRYPLLSGLRNEIREAYSMLESTYADFHKLLIAGNGGSAADSEHMAGELMKGFRLKRPISETLSNRLMAVDVERGRLLSRNLEKPLAAVPLVAHEALSTACLNDINGNDIFAQQLFGYGCPGDAFLAISTSGNSENIMNAAILARALDIKVVSLTGQGGGMLKKYSDVCVCVPETETYKIQELHLPIYHTWCLMLEEHFFGD